MSLSAPSRLGFLACIWFAWLTAVLFSSGSLAGGDLFDDDYRDCPVKTRMRSGQIANLTLARDAEEADRVNVSWTGSSPVGWGLGSNAFLASLVVIADDGDLHEKTVSLATREVSFEGMATGAPVTVQLAIVVDAADASYVISDILEANFHQSLTAPSFKTGWTFVVDGGSGNPVPRTMPGAMYYVGYNANFGNYRADGLATNPRTPRLRIGLAHSDNETAAARDDAGFDGYVLRIVDADGDVVPEGDDVATVTSAYGAGVVLLIAAGNHQAEPGGDPLNNIRINNDGVISESVYALQDRSQIIDNFTFAVGVVPNNLSLSTIIPHSVATMILGSIYAEPPDEHRDFPDDILASDETYTISAWALSDEDEVISPVASLALRPVDVQWPSTQVSDEFNASQDVDSLVVTKFTALE